ncbi:MAG TPA: HPr-rel-A system PqqD family peptide chaperone [Thauera sp.]|jgi:PqqD family protein of HPr-rel-A system|nr:HPr-rel-A system PqqD family peptide chaperone [Thauera sp.]HRA82106.1 HPr-rel-A system PqqD family peptide chaperone [Thauera sp.]
MWDGDVVLYDSQSGNTHRLLHPAGVIVNALNSAERLSAEALYEVCAASHRLDRSSFEQSLALLLDLSILTPS